MSQEPIRMILHCPTCGLQHIDRPNHWSDRFDPPTGSEHPDDLEALLQAAKAYEAEWTNPAHKSHKCLRCGEIWRPADVYTTGVLEIKTSGQHDSYKPLDLWKILELESTPVDDKKYKS